MRPRRLIWLSAEGRGDLLAEATRRAPLETGGVLIGYWSNASEAVVRHVIGPGPASIHREDSFVPDYDYHMMKVADLYHASAGVEVYLGDWHSHPRGGLARLSTKDRRALHRIASDRAARAPVAISILVAGDVGDWELRAWTGSIGRILWWPRLKLQECRIRTYR